MNQPIRAASGIVALLLMLSFNFSAVTGETSIQAQRRPIKKARTRPDYSEFLHRTHLANEKTACDSCHKFPTANWKDVRQGDAAFPDVAEFPEHGACLNCHRQQFFARQRPAPAICSNCHVNVTPRATARFLFPSLGDVTNCGQRKQNHVSEFKLSFPHDKHEDQECVACHQKETPEAGDKSGPKSHAVCFSCHNVEAELSPAPSACNKCHELAAPGRVSRVSDPDWRRSVPPAVAGGSAKRIQKS